jgi:hypothetical protein
MSLSVNGILTIISGHFAAISRPRRGAVPGPSEHVFFLGKGCEVSRIRDSDGTALPETRTSLKESVDARPNSASFERLKNQAAA